VGKGIIIIIIKVNLGSQTLVKSLLA